MSTVASYPLSTAFGRHAVRLQPDQVAWIHAIMKSPKYRYRLSHLHFALASFDEAPIIVWDDEYRHQLQIVGADCHDIFFPNIGVQREHDSIDIHGCGPGLPKP
jgi:hypothetical protein